MAESGLSSARFQIGLLRPLGWLVFVGLVLVSLYLSINRIYQVDEVQMVFQSRSLAHGETASFYTYAPFHHLGPMAWAARHAHTAKELFTWNRLIYLPVFWLNILLTARICAGRWRHPAFLPWLLLAATLEPLWDYGFEIRHDNLLLTGILLLWLLLRSLSWRPDISATLIGFLAVILQFVAFKSFLYWIPVTLALMILPSPRFQALARTRLVVLWLAGAATGLAVVRLAYALGGGWETALDGFRGGVSVSVSVERFSPISTLLRMVSQIPFIVGAGVAATARAIHRWKSQGRSFLRWETTFPELVLLACLLCSFLANPTPFPYNLLFLTPFFLIMAAEILPEFLDGLRPAALVATVTIAVFCHFIPFMTQTARHFDYPNDRQEALMTVAEQMTAPGKDAVFDGTGLLPTRATIGYRWQLHSLTIKHFLDGSWPSVRQLLEKTPAAVIIPNYRTDWLSPADRGYIAQHYIALADDFLVLGTTLPAGGGEFTCLHPGRYEIRPMGSTPSPAPIMLDGLAVPPKSPVLLSSGTHVIRTESPGRVLVAWLGPTLDQLPPLAPGNHLRLFVNWY